MAKDEFCNVTVKYVDDLGSEAAQGQNTTHRFLTSMLMMMLAHNIQNNIHEPDEKILTLKMNVYLLNKISHFSETWKS